MNNIKDRQYGSYMAGCIGDALGMAVEFRPPGSFAPVSEYRNGGPFNLNAGDWTDDSSMALALADSLSVCWNLEDQLNKYVEWWSTGKYSVNGRCFDIGNTTRDSLARYVTNKNPLKASDPNPKNSGNGSIMRLSPIPIKYYKCFPNNIEELSEKAALSSIVTHASEQCQSACRYMALIIAGLINGVDKKTVLSSEWDALKKLVSIKPLSPDITEVSKGSFKVKQPPAIKGSGWVVESLEAALWAFYSNDNIEEALKAAVNLGNDADSTGSVTGQIVGACYGESRIPKRWLEGLTKVDYVRGMIGKIIES